MTVIDVVVVYAVVIAPIISFMLVRRNSIANNSGIAPLRFTEHRRIHTHPRCFTP